MSPRQRNTLRRIHVGKGRNHKRARLWQALRILREFTADDLVAVTEAPNRVAVQTFLSQLKRAGYLVTANPDGIRRATRYRLVRNTGPLCPSVIRAGTVAYDPNNETEYSLNEQ